MRTQRGSRYTEGSPAAPKRAAHNCMFTTLFGTVEEEPTLLDKLKAGIQKTRSGLVSAIEDAVSGKKEIDADVLDELEYSLITADIGRTWGISRQLVSRLVNEPDPESP